MLTRLRLANLKTWGERIWPEGVALAPVTLVLGANSSGKTSLLQMPLLVKQTFRGPDRLAHLNLGGHRNDLVHHGDYQSLIHDHVVSRQLKLGLSFREGTGAHDPLIDYTVSYSAERGRPFVKRLELARNGHSFAATRQANGTYSIEGPGYEPASRDRAGRRAFEPLRALSFSGAAAAALGPSGAEVQQISRSLQLAVDNIAYLGPLREYPERAYMWTGPAPRSLGRKGERAVHALMADENAPDRPAGASPLVDQVSAWLRRLGLADQLVLSRQSSTRSYELVVHRAKQRANIVDVGFGVSQVLPVIVLACSVPPGGTIILEQPELHLHSGAQAGLADLLVEVTRERQVQFLVETHSDLLLRRLQSLLADDHLTPAQCALYQVDADGGEASIARLGVDELGRVSN